MNAPSPSTERAEVSSPVATALINQTPPRSQSLMGILIALGIGITSILSMLAFAEQLAPQYAGYAAGATGILVALLKLIISIGDYFDNGLMDNSFNFGGKVNPATLKQWTGVFLLGCLLGLSSCSTVGMSDSKLAWSKAGVEAAQIAVTIAGSQLLAAIAEPDTPAWQTAAAQKAMELAIKQLAAAEAKYQAEQDLRAAKATQATLDLTSGK